MRDEQILALVYGEPWAMLPSAFEVVQEIVDAHAIGATLDVASRIAAARQVNEKARERSDAGLPQTLRVIPVVGMVSHRMGMLADVSGGADVGAISASLRAAVAAPEVKGIILDVHSPGGPVQGVQELADEIFASRGAKPIVAVANAQMASSAYWLASQADEIVVTPSGEVGAVGVFITHRDHSRALEAAGITETVISAGPHKAEWLPSRPLSEEAKEHMKSVTEKIYGRFAATVARGLGISAEQVKGRSFGGGRVVQAADAVAAGMAHRVATFSQTIERMAQAAGGSGRSFVAMAAPRTAAEAEAVFAAASIGTTMEELHVEPPLASEEGAVIIETTTGEAPNAEEDKMANENKEVQPTVAVAAVAPSAADIASIVQAVTTELKAAQSVELGEIKAQFSALQQQLADSNKNARIKAVESELDSLVAQLRMTGGERAEELTLMAELSPETMEKRLQKYRSRHQGFAAALSQPVSFEAEALSATVSHLDFTDPGIPSGADAATLSVIAEARARYANDPKAKRAFIYAQMGETDLVQ